MEIKALHVNKGGVGKTSLANMIAFEAANKGKDVVILDLDLSQGNSSLWLMPAGKKIEKEVGDYLRGDSEIKDVLVEIREHIFLLPCRSTQSVTKKWARNEGRRPEGEVRIMELFNELDNLGFDYCIIDLAPGLEDMQELVLTYVDEVINVFMPDSFGLSGLTSWREQIKDVHSARKIRHREPFKNNWLILNNIHEGYSLHKDIRNSFKELGVDLLELNTDAWIPKLTAIHCFPQEVSDTKESTRAQLKKIGDAICL